jgi:hypothetical protein
MTPEKLAEAEKKAAALLNELNSVERALSSCSPADPARVSLKARKADVLSRYQGTKATVKELRRQLTATSQIGTNPSPKLSPVPTKREDLMMRLYEVLAQAVDRHHEGTPVFLDGELSVVNQFLDMMEPPE